MGRALIVSAILLITLAWANPFPAWPEKEGQAPRVRILRPTDGSTLCGLGAVDLLVDVDYFSAENRCFLELRIDGQPASAGTTLVGEGAPLEGEIQHVVVSTPRLQLSWRPSAGHLGRWVTIRLMVSADENEEEARTTSVNDSVEVLLQADAGVCGAHLDLVMGLEPQRAAWQSRSLALGAVNGSSSEDPRSSRVRIRIPFSNLHLFRGQSNNLEYLVSSRTSSVLGVGFWVNRQVVGELPSIGRVMQGESFTIPTSNYIEEPGWHELCISTHFARPPGEREGPFGWVFLDTRQSHNEVFWSSIGYTCVHVLYDDPVNIPFLSDLVPPCPGPHLRVCEHRKDCNFAGVCDLLGWCRCDADYYDVSCQHSAISGLSYMPQAYTASTHTYGIKHDVPSGQSKFSQIASVSEKVSHTDESASCGVSMILSQCESARDWGLQAEELAYKLEAWEMKVSDASQCNEGSVLLFQNDNFEWQGAGSHVLYLTGVVSHALREGKALSVSGKSPLEMHNRRCLGTRTFACYFESPIGAACRDRTWQDLAEGSPKDLRTEVDATPLKEFAQMGRLWWHAQMAAFIMRPRMSASRVVNTIARSIGFETPCVGVHIRRGESCAKHDRSRFWYRSVRGSCKEFDEYATAILKLGEKTSFQSAYIASDAETAAPAVQKILNERGSNIRVVNLRLGSTMALFSSTVENSPNSADVLREGLVATAGESSLVDLMLLRQCSCFVGTFSSEFSRLALLLMAADRGFLPPYISLDVPFFANDDIGIASSALGVTVPEAYDILRSADWNLASVLGA